MRKCLISLEITRSGLAGGDKPRRTGGGEWRSQLPPRDQISRKLVALATQRALFITHAFLAGFIADEEPAEEALDLTKTDYSRPARMEEIAGESWRFWGADFDTFR